MILTTLQAQTVNTAMQALDMVSDTAHIALSGGISVLEYGCTVCVMRYAPGIPFHAEKYRTRADFATAYSVTAPPQNLALRWLQTLIDSPTVPWDEAQRAAAIAALQEAKNA